MQKAIRTNLKYSILLKLLNILIPLITFPYVARILLPSGIGRINFAISLIEYFILLAMIGIPIYGVREVSRAKKSKYELTKTVQEIMIINIAMSILSFIILLLLVFFITALNEYKGIILILSLNIFTTAIGIEWFFQGIEEFRYITIRSIIVKSISLISVYLFVKTPNDLLNYVIILVISNGFNNILNFFYSRKFVKLFRILDNYEFKKHIKPIITLFVFTISVSLYINLDKTMIGIFSGDASVGFYTVANKIPKFVVSLITSIGIVLLPRISFYLKEDMFEKAEELIKKSFTMILIIGLPSVIGVMFFSEPIILILGGINYIESKSALMVMSPIILFIPLTNLIGIQLFVPLGKEKITLLSTSVASVINFILNLILIPKFDFLGAAISTLVAESIVLIVQYYFAKSIIKRLVDKKDLSQIVISALFMLLFLYLASYTISITILNMLLLVTISVIIYLLLLLFFKNELILKEYINIKSSLSRRIKKICK